VLTVSFQSWLPLTLPKIDTNGNANPSAAIHLLKGHIPVEFRPSRYRGHAAYTHRLRVRAWPRLPMLLQPNTSGPQMLNTHDEHADERVIQCLRRSPDGNRQTRCLSITTGIQGICQQWQAQSHVRRIVHDPVWNDNPQILADGIDDTQVILSDILTDRAHSTDDSDSSSSVGNASGSPTSSKVTKYYSVTS